MVVNERLTTSKDIILVREEDDLVYDDAKSICEHICGNIYFPSSLEENDETETALDDGYVSTFFSDPVWIRIVYDKTVGNWTDPDNIEKLTFDNFGYGEDATYRGHVIMRGYGRWDTKFGTHSLSEYALCELSSKTVSSQQITLNGSNDYLAIQDHPFRIIGNN